MRKYKRNPLFSKKEHKTKYLEIEKEFFKSNSLLKYYVGMFLLFTTIPLFIFSDNIWEWYIALYIIPVCAYTQHIYFKFLIYVDKNLKTQNYLIKRKTEDNV